MILQIINQPLWAISTDWPLINSDFASVQFHGASSYQTFFFFISKRIYFEKDTRENADNICGDYAIAG